MSSTRVLKHNFANRNCTIKITRLRPSHADVHHIAIWSSSTAQSYRAAARMSTVTTEAPAHDFPPSAVREILNEVTTLLKSRNETVSIVETAAGGLVSSSILSQPGASKIYKGGLTLYTLPSRISYGGWTKESIESYRGPTTDIVEDLARTVRKELGSTYTLAESGTAGPTGGNTPNRQPGYVALAVDSESGGTTSKDLNTGLGGDRIANMVRFAVEGLTLLRDVIKSQPAKL